LIEHTAVTIWLTNSEDFVQCEKQFKMWEGLNYIFNSSSVIYWQYIA